MGHVCQLANDTVDNPNQQLEDLIFTRINLRRISDTSEASLFSDIYSRDVTGKQEYMMLKDFHFNLYKTLFPVAELIFNDSSLRKQMFTAYKNFFQFEYAFLVKGRRDMTALAVPSSSEEL